MKKVRLDKLLVNRRLADSDRQARSLIMAGKVLVDECPVDKPGSAVAVDAKIKIRGQKLRYVSRGGIKLEHALCHFHLDVRGTVALDVGASTGGFTDCLLKHGAEKVYAIDVGHGQLAESLRKDPRVVVIDRTNIRHLPAEHLPERPSLAVIDVSFISLANVFPAVDALLAKGARVVALVKPQFECARDEVGEGGIVRDAKVRKAAIECVIAAAKKLGWNHKGTCVSPITGAKGNQEFLAFFIRSCR